MTFLDGEVFLYASGLRLSGVRCVRICEQFSKQTMTPDGNENPCVKEIRNQERSSPEKKTNKNELCVRPPFLARHDEKLPAAQFR